MQPLPPMELTPVQARVLGTLMEKARTVPDTYPLSLNLVLTGCNQKTSREPVMDVTEAQAQEALDDLKALGLVIESHGSRVAKYEHNFQRTLGVPEQSAVLLGLLLLRGPQTAAQLRTNADRWYRFADISSVEGFLNELADRPDDKGGPLVLHLPRAPSEREARWAHLLCGPVDVAANASGLMADSADPASAGGQDDRISQLETEVAELRQRLDNLCAELGLSPGGRAAGGEHATTAHSEETH
ncbi:YceH family protein [Ottowia sp.]|uniref:YceH family protein n=1 Tax=Ottowia sp. TaxID=1898956 RepID=UPI003A8833B8